MKEFPVSLHSHAYFVNAPSSGQTLFRAELTAQELEELQTTSNGRAVLISPGGDRFEGRIQGEPQATSSSTYDVVFAKV